MKKSLAALIALGLAVGMQAGVVSCEYPVTEVQPVYKTVIKKIPSKECWDEEKCITTPTTCNSCNPCEAVVVAQKCIVTKCKTVWTTVEEQVLVGYNNYAIVCGKKIKKFAKCQLKSIKVTGTY